MIQLFLNAYKNSNQKQQLIWLFVSCLMIILMVAVGGITRLTESGLSIVKWEPVTGIVPPLTESQWLEEFALYQQSPQYQKVNKGMSLADFKTIYFWEWFHRFLGRMIGLIFFLPFIYFLTTKKLTPFLKKHGVFIFILGGLQGVMGWYMVKSGLVDRPDVSHYRLAAHLLLAFFIIAYIFNIFLRVLFENSKAHTFPIQPNDHLKLQLIQKTIHLFSLILFIQILYGAFLAKLKGGYYYNTFPLMGSFFIPPEVFMFTPWVKDILENPVTIQLIHRLIAYVLFSIGLLLSIYVYRNFKHFQILQKTSLLWMGVLVFQFLLGVLTLIFSVPISLAVFHQLGGCLLVLATTLFYFFACIHKSL